MKKLFFILLVLLITTIAYSQTPQPIYSFATVRHTTQWYKQQQQLWKAETEKDAKNATAWYHYFKATRTLNKLDENDKRTREEKDKQLHAIVAQMQQNIPNAAEYHHAEWIVAGLGDMTKLPHLQKAAELWPDNPFIFSDMINWGELDRDMEKRNTYAAKWFSSGQASPGFLNYAYNMLAGLKENAILITVGDNDTYPVWILQSVQGFRKDVTVINSSLILVKEYREKLFKELGVPQLGFDPFSSGENFTRFESELAKTLAANTKNKPVYISLTANEGIVNPHKDNLYLTGLAYQYSTSPIDNMAALKKNFEQCYALDYLDKNFYPDVSAELVKKLNVNYTIPMVKLHEHYINAGETQKAQHIKALALSIVAGTEYETQVNNYFKK